MFQKITKGNNLISLEQESSIFKESDDISISSI